MKRVFLVGRVGRKSRALVFVGHTTSPIAGPFALCAQVTAKEQ
jgi:hypothetical protein